MLPAVMMLLDWAAGEAAAPWTPTLHYHTLEGPSRKRHTIEGPSAKRITIEGPSKRVKQLTGAN